MAETLRQRIERHEGRRARVYDDATGQDIIPGYTVVGNPTIGIGRLVSGKGGLSTDEIMGLLDNDIEIARYRVFQSMPWIKSLNTTRQEVLIEMCFQTGLGRLLQFKNMLTALELGNYDKAADEMMNSLWAKQTLGRAKELAAIMRSGNVGV